MALKVYNMYNHTFHLKVVWCKQFLLYYRILIVSFKINLLDMDIMVMYNVLGYCKMLPEYIEI